MVIRRILLRMSHGIVFGHCGQELFIKQVVPELSA